MKRIVKSAASKSQRVATKFKGKGRTKQEFEPECNINNIVARYQRTGALDHFARYGAQYGEVPAVDLRQALEIGQKSAEMFMALPSKVRERCNGSPVEFLEFVQNPANHDEMVELGLTEAPPVPVRLEASEGVSETPKEQPEAPVAQEGT